MVHFGPNPVPNTTAGELYDISHGRASILFVLLAGIGISFLTGNRGSKGTTPAPLELIIRGAILLPLGLWLQDLDHGVLVILQFYAMYFFFAALVVSLSTPVLLSIVASLLLAGPIIRNSLEQRYSEWFVSSTPSMSTPLIEILRDLVISGYYPLITWGAPLVLGMIIGRMNLRDGLVRGSMIIGGIVLIVGSTVVSRSVDFATNGNIAPLLSPEPHSQSHVWMIDAIGVSALTLGLCLVASDRAARLLWPIASTGQLALTIYVGHLILLDRYTDLLRQDTIGDAAISVGIFMMVAILVSALWRAFIPIGPLEAVFRVPSMLLKRSG